MKVLIVDDETPARMRLRGMLEAQPGFDVAGEAANGQEALQQVAALNPDVVLLDIRMPGMSGIEAAHHLASSEAPPAVIFTTAFDEYAIEAFDARAIGYVLKPVRRERLFRALEQAARLSRDSLELLGQTPQVSEPRQHVCTRVRNELRLIPIDEVHCFKADQKYVRVCHSGGDNLIDDSLKLLEAEFHDRFVRIHRSALVSISRIESLQKTADGQIRVRLRDSCEDPQQPLLISRRHLAEVRRRLKGS